MKGYWSCMKTVDHSYEQALIMHDNLHIHVIMNIIVTPTVGANKNAVDVDYDDDDINGVWEKQKFDVNVVCHPHIETQKLWYFVDAFF